VTLAVYDVAGARVRTLIDGTRTAGRHGEVWDGRDSNGQLVGSGVYFYRLRTDDAALTKKMVLLK